MNGQLSEEPLVNYLRVHRQAAGLSQRDVGLILGYGDPEAVAQHERFRSLPPLLAALGYEVMFQVPVSEIFAGLRYVMEQSVEKHIGEFEMELKSREIEGFRAKGHQQKLRWLTERKSETKTMK
jgi:DNA-binding XRE family transcriptional regulator